jgi:hypothetical protein
MEEGKIKSVKQGNEYEMSGKEGRRGSAKASGERAGGRISL